MKEIFLFILNILLLRFQSSLSKNLFILEVPLLICIWYVLNKGIFNGLIFSNFLGLVSDYVLGYPIGFYGFSLVLTSYITFFLYNNFYIISKYFLFILFLISHIINFILLFLLMKIFKISLVRDLFFSGLFSCFFGSIILIFLFKKK